MTTNRMRKGQTYSLPAEYGTEPATYVGSVRLLGLYWIFRTVSGDDIYLPAGTAITPTI